jgi:hypothetical protein
MGFECSKASEFFEYNSFNFRYNKFKDSYFSDLEEITMSPREDVVRLIQSLPENVSLEEIMAELYVRMKIEAGLKQLDAGEGIEHEAAKERLGKWLSN